VPRSPILVAFPAASNNARICAARSSSLIKQSPSVGDVDEGGVEIDGANDGSVEGNVEFEKSSTKSSVKLENVGMNDGEDEG